MAKRVMRWFLFSIVVGVIPVVLNGVLALLTSKVLDLSVMWDLSVLFGRGELLMLSVGLSAATVGDVVASRGLSSALKMPIIGISFVMGLVTVGIYGIVLALRESDSTILGDAVAVVSLIPYIIMVLVNGASIVTVKR